MKMLLGNVIAKVCRADIFKPAIVNESLYDISNDNGVVVVILATSKKSHCQTYTIPTL
jgi:hypothetical protein